MKLTSNDTRIANAIVKPKLVMNRPTMPPMNPTGTNTAISDSVVASTARPISRVASMAACIGGRPFSSTKRYMFSSTTIASSITMPTASASANIVIEFSVKPWNHISANVAMIDVGIAIAAMNVERKFHRNNSTTSRENRADDQVLLDALDRRLDEHRLVAHDLDS